MHVPTRLALLASLAILYLYPCQAQMTESSAAADKTVTVHISRFATPQVLPPTLFGSFLEPIGHSTYGGLWADVVENPSFEDGLWSAAKAEAMIKDDPELLRASQLDLPMPWKPLHPEQGNRYAPIRQDAANSYQSLLLMGMPGKETGIAQTVYLPVQRELSYHGSVFLKHVEGSPALTVSLRRHGNPEQVLVSAPIEASATDWTKYTFSLALKPGQAAPLEPVDLVLATNSEARLQIDNVSLNPDDAVDRMDPDVVQMARALHTPVVRFGGNFTSAYDWQDGTGPLDKRVSKLNLSWGIPEYNTFGTDEFLEFCRQIHARPQIAVNLGTGTPTQAAQWVSYVNERWGDHQSDYRGGLLWELGNELWGDWQIGYPSLDQVAARTLATSQAIRAVDPKAQLIATGADEDHFDDWNAQQLTNPTGTYNYLSTHFVVTDDVELANPSDTFVSMAALALPWGLGPRMHAIQQQAASAGHGDVKVAFTEWLMVSRSRRGPHFTNMGGALFAGGFLNMAMRNADVVPISDMTGILEFGGIWKKRGQVYGAPAYWVLRSYAAAQPHFLLKVEDDSPTYSITKGIRRIPNIPDTPYLDIVAAETEDRSSLLLFCVNRHLTRPIAANFDLAALGVRAGSATTATVTGENVLSENDEQDPDRVTAVPHTLAIKPRFSYTFPNASVTVIQIPLKP